MTAKYVLPMIGVLGLTACGGSGGTSAPSFAQLDFEADNLTAQLVGATTSPSIPTSNTGQYEGVIVMTDDLSGIAPATTEDGFIGDVFLQANFASGGSISGSAGGFYAVQVDNVGDPSGPASAVSGSLDLTASSLSPGSTAVTLNVTGNLQVNGGLNSITGTMEGGFGDLSGSAAGTANLLVFNATGGDIAVGGGGAIGDLDASIIAVDN